jgi:hypothetical protein
MYFTFAIKRLSSGIGISTEDQTHEEFKQGEGEGEGVRVGEFDYKICEER